MPCRNPVGCIRFRVRAESDISPPECPRDSVSTTLYFRLWLLASHDSMSPLHPRPLSPGQTGLLTVGESERMRMAMSSQLRFKGQHNRGLSVEATKQNKTKHQTSL